MFSYAKNWLSSVVSTFIASYILTINFVFKEKVNAAAASKYDWAAKPDKICWPCYMDFGFYCRIIQLSVIDCRET